MHNWPSWCADPLPPMVHFSTSSTKIIQKSINKYICIHFIYMLIFMYEYHIIVCFFWERLKKYKWENSLIYVYCQSHIQRLLHDVFVDWLCKASLNTHINRKKIYSLLNTKMGNRFIKLTFQNYSAQGNHSVIRPFKNRFKAHVLCFNTAFFVYSMWLK